MKKTILLLLLVFVLSVGGTLGITLAVKNCNNKPSSEQSSSTEQNSSNQEQSSGNDSSQNGNENEQPSDAVLSFSDKNANKVITQATFDESLYTANASSKILPYKLFSDGMCLQRDAINHVWGNIFNSEHLAVELNGKTYYGTVEGDEFDIYLPKMNAGGPYSLTFISEAGRRTLQNVYIGEVFLLSGQSNMEFRPEDSKGVLADLYTSNSCVNDNIRMFRVGWDTPTVPSTLAIQYANWTGANQSTIKSFSAVGYLFGKQMQEELGCPVGLIANPVGGSSIEFWLSEANYNKVQEHYTTYTDNTTIMTPCLGYNGMLYGLAGLNVRGVVWYQGESNAFGTQEYYDIALKIYMDQCREMFDNEQLFFTFCELARYEGLPYQYSVVNERINYVAKNDNYAVVARNLDQGEWNDIHPRDKRAIGARAAYETLRVFFNKNKPAPVEVESYTFNQDGSVTINLTRECELKNGSNGFEVYVNGRYSYNCNVSISGKQLTVSANGRITMVRYGYTCVMTDDVKQDVSKMVTVYDDNRFPLDLFVIADENADNAVSPSLSSGGTDLGYEISVNSEGNYVVNKFANAAQWTGARFTISDYSSEYDSFVIKFATDNVTNFNIQFLVSGPSWTTYITVYQTVLGDGEHEVTVDFSAIEMVDANWNSMPGCYMKDYQIDAVIFTLDTAVDTSQLIAEDASCTIYDVTFKAE